MALLGPSSTNSVSAQIVDSAMRVHSALGPGLLESAYEACLRFELVARGLDVRSQVELPLRYRGVTLDVGYRLDLVVGDAVIVEVKAIAALRTVHEAQLLSYLKLSGYRVGVLINFHVAHLRDGIVRRMHSR